MTERVQQQEPASEPLERGPAPAGVGCGGLAERVLALQRTAGNAAVARLVQRGPLGPEPGAARVLARAPGSAIGTTRFEIDQQRRADLEAAETGAGRQTTLDRLAAMSDLQTRREAPGIAFRAQDRGDAELARAATDRLLAAWLASTDHPVTFAAGFGPDAVDVLLDRAETAFDGDEPELGGALLSVAMVQLVRAARIAVLRRPTTDGQELRGFFEVLGEPQRDQELEVRRRVERARALLELRGRTAVAAGDAAAQRFEAIAEAVHAAERLAGPAIAGDLGEGGPVVAAAEPSPGSTLRAGGSLSGRRDAPPAPAADAPATGSPVTPAVRAPQHIENSAHPDLEGALVLYATGPMQYGNIRSSRYAVAGTLAGARRLARELFGRHTCVIVERLGARDAAGAPEIQYLILPLSLSIKPPSAPPDGDGLVGLADVEMLTFPPVAGYRFVCVTAGPWIFFRPSMRERIARLDAAEQAELAAGFEPPVLDTAARREAVFGPIDRLIDAGAIQDAVDQLVTIDAQGFALVDVGAKVSYVTALLRAYTYEPHERTVVEVFRSLRDDDELRALLAGLDRNGVLGKLRSDLETAFPSLLVALGRRDGASALSLEQAIGLVRALIRIDFLDRVITLNSDGSVTVFGDLRAAVEQLLATLSAAVGGTIDAILDPEAVLKGLWKLVHFAFMLHLARHGHRAARAYVNRVEGAIAAELAAALRGLVALQENAPGGDELVRNLADAIKWRVTWEVLGLFVGVGEAAALIDGIRAGRGAAAIAEAALELGNVGRATNLAEDTARLADDTARLADNVARGADDTARLADNVARGAEDTARHADDAVRAAEDTTGGGAHEPPGGGRQPPSGDGGPGGPTRPVRDTLNTPEGQIHHESPDTLRKALSNEFKPPSKGLKPRVRSGTAPSDRSALKRRFDDALNALPKTPANAKIRARIDNVYKILRDAGAIEKAIVELWEEATRLKKTPREVLLEKVGAPAGGGGREIVAGKVRISDDGRATEILKLLTDAEFRDAIRQGAPIRDLALAHENHGAYTHMFQEWLIDRAMGEGEGRKFRQWLAGPELEGLPKVMTTPKREREFFAAAWDSLFDEFESGHINTPETLGELLWKHGGFPIHDMNKKVP